MNVDVIKKVLVSIGRWLLWLPVVGAIVLFMSLDDGRRQEKTVASASNMGKCQCKSCKCRDKNCGKATKKVLPTDTIAVDSTLKGRIKALITENEASGLGMYVYDITAGKEVFTYNADELMSTASNMKILTVMAAIHQRGLHYPFINKVYYNGVIQNGVLYGDVCLKFSYDPLLTPAVVGAMEAALADAHIREVKGRVIVDTPIDKALPDEAHWVWNDLKRDYLSPVFLGQDNLNDVVANGLDSLRITYNPTLVVKGNVANNSREIYTHIDAINASLFYTIHNSSNLNAESLLYTLCRGKENKMPHREKALAVLDDFIKNEIKQNPRKVSVVHDGCGLCPHDKLTPRFIAQLLQYGYNHKDIYNFLKSTLPVAGQTGTLKKRMKNTAAEGKVMAKTGRLTRNDGVSSLSGYAQAKNGHILVFSILQNRMAVENANYWQDKMCQEFVK